MGESTPAEVSDPQLDAFKRDVEKLIPSEFSEAHGHLAVAYHEMGLYQDAVREAGLALGGTADHAVTDIALKGVGIAGGSTPTATASRCTSSTRSLEGDLDARFAECGEQCTPRNVENTHGFWRAPGRPTACTGRDSGGPIAYTIGNSPWAGRVCRDALTQSTPLNLTRRIRRLYDALRQGLVERDEALYLALLSAAAGEHLLLIGPPGTAKSELARRLHLAFADARYFERLLTRFSVPEELFGPLSLKALERDSYERLIDGYLPSAHVAFLDEIFEANSAILNALLGILNERVFDNGAQRRPVPLACVIAASNEIPDNVPALSDRFLVRLLVGPVSDDGFDALLRATAVTPPSDEERLRFEELSTICDSANRVDVPGWAIDLIRSLRTALSAKGIDVSDRRWRKTVHLLRTSAVLAGRDAVALADLGVLSHVLWQQPAQRPMVEEILTKIAAETLEEEPARYKALVETLEQTLTQERNAKTEGRDDGGVLYRDPKGGVTHEAFTRRHKKNRFGELLFESPTTRAPVTLEDLRSLLPDLGAVRAYASDPTKWIVDEVPHEAIVSPRRYSKDHVSARVTQVERILENLRSFQEELGAAGGIASRREGAIEKADFLEPPTAHFAEGTRRALSTLAALSERLETLRRGFASLPSDDAASEVTA